MSKQHHNHTAAYLLPCSHIILQEIIENDSTTNDLDALSRFYLESKLEKWLEEERIQGRLFIDQIHAQRMKEADIHTTPMQENDLHTTALLESADTDLRVIPMPDTDLHFKGTGKTALHQEILETTLQHSTTPKSQEMFKNVENQIFHFDEDDHDHANAVIEGDPDKDEVEVENIDELSYLPTQYGSVPINISIPNHKWKQIPPTKEKNFEPPHEYAARTYQESLLHLDHLPHSASFSGRKLSLI